MLARVVADARVTHGSGRNGRVVCAFVSVAKDDYLGGERADVVGDVGIRNKLHCEDEAGKGEDISRL